MEVPFGYCHCECGQKTPIQKNNNPARGYVRGQPSKYCLGHNARRPRPAIVQPDDPNIRYVALTRGQIAAVDAFNYEWIKRCGWIALYDPKLGGYYAVRRVRKHEGNTGEDKISMHALIYTKCFGPVPEGKVVDHRNRQSLWNLVSNLRAATPEENGRNQKLRKSNTSGVMGVNWDNTHQTYMVRISVNKKRIKIGQSPIFEEAVKMRRAAEAEYYGEFSPDVTKVLLTRHASMDRVDTAIERNPSNE